MNGEVIMPQLVNGSEGLENSYLSGFSWWQVTESLVLTVFFFFIFEGAEGIF